MASSPSTKQFQNFGPPLHPHNLIILLSTLNGKTSNQDLGRQGIKKIWEDKKSRFGKKRNQDLGRQGIKIWEDKESRFGKIRNQDLGR